MSRAMMPLPHAYLLTVLLVRILVLKLASPSNRHASSGAMELFLPNGRVGAPLGLIGPSLTGITAAARVTGTVDICPN
jgi:hypothetical protein